MSGLDVAPNAFLNIEQSRRLTILQAVIGIGTPRPLTWGDVMQAVRWIYSGETS